MFFAWTNHPSPAATQLKKGKTSLQTVPGSEKTSRVQFFFILTWVKTAQLLTHSFLTAGSKYLTQWKQFVCSISFLRCVSLLLSYPISFIPYFFKKLGKVFFNAGFFFSVICVHLVFSLKVWRFYDCLRSLKLSNIFLYPT